MQGDDDLTLDFGGVKDWFKRKKEPPKQAAPQKTPEETPAPEEQSPAKPEKRETQQDPPAEDDEAITVDFSKIGGWFKSNAPAHNPAAAEDDIAIDLSKIKGWFSSKGASHHGTDKEELTFEFGAALSWVKRHPVLVLLLLIIILQFVPNRIDIAGHAVYMPWGGAWMRMLSQDLPAADGWSTNHVHSVLRNQIASGINQQYPNLPDERKNKLIDEEWQKLYESQGPQIEQQVEAVRQQIKAFWKYEADGKSYTYMPDIDPYFYLRYARNYVEKGMLGDEMRDGKEWDTHMNAPLGIDVTFLAQPYVLAWQYTIMRVFSPKITLMQAATYFPIIFIILSIIPAFFIGRKLAGTAGGIVTATMIAIAPPIIARTTWGHADTDPWIVFFPVLLTYIYIMLMDAKDRKHILCWGIAGGLATGLFAWTWPGGWWYVFDFLLAAFGILVLSELWHARSSATRMKEKVMHYALVGAPYVISSAVFVTLFVSWRAFYNTILNPFHFTIIKAASHVDLWPNVYTTVAELNPIDVNGVINSIGGKLYFWIALAGIALLLLRKSEGRWNIDLKYGPLLALWFIATIYASTKGVRFTLLLAPAFAVAFGIAIGKLYAILARLFTKDFNLNPKVVHVILIFIVVLMTANQAHAAYGTALGDIPIMNDAWWNALTAIKEDSKPDAIINSWWDFGHHFKYVADRAVTFDGASQNTPMAHWIGRVLSTSNEAEAVGILRMLDCGSNKAFETLNAELNDPVKSMKILYKIITVDRKAALAMLAKEGIDEQEKVLGYTHCDPPENYHIASDDMIGKSGVWSHFGLWNFERAKLWIELREQDEETAVQYMVKEWDYTQQQAEQAYLDVQSLSSEEAANSWISPWLGILGGSSDCGVDNGIVSCGNGVQHNLSNGDTVVSAQQGTGRPPFLVIPTEDGGFKETKYNESNIGVAVLLYQTGPTNYRSVLASPELIKGMFVRMYFIDGHGLKHFTMLNRQQHLTGGEVIVYKVNWTGTAKPKVFGGFENIKQIKEEESAKKAAEEAGKATDGNTVSVYYTGALLDGTVFDSSIKDWKTKDIAINSSFDDFELSQPLTFTIGSGQVIGGFDAAVRGMKAGEEQIVQIPPNAAYGTDPKAHKLGNQTLKFRIRMIKIE